MSDIVCSPGTAPWVQPDNVSQSSPQDVWFQYALTNPGSEDESTSGIFAVVTDAQGNQLDSQAAPDTTVPAGGDIQQGINFDGSIMAGAAEGPCWIILYDAENNNMGGARVDLQP